MIDSGQQIVPMLFVLAALVLFVVAGLLYKTREGMEYGLSGRYSGKIGGGAAIASSWMSAASFLGIAGVMYLNGYAALAYVIGWTGGYVLLLVLLAGQLRRFGKYTAPDFIGERYESSAARLVSALISIVISYIYSVAQFKGIGILFAWLLGTGYRNGVIIGAGVLMGYIVFSGIMGVARSQKLQYFVLIVTFILPLMFLAYRLGYFWLLPQFGYGKGITALATEFGINMTAPFTGFGLYQWTALCFTLMFGTAGLPHVLSRFYTVSNVRDARWNVVWGLFFIALIYWSAPAYAVFGRLLEARGGLTLSAEAMRQSADFIVIRTALLGGLPSWLVGLLAAGAVSAAFFTVAGLLMTGAASFSYDIYYRILNPHASENSRMDVAKGATLALAFLVLLGALNPPGMIAEIAAVAFALAGNTIFPAFLLGIWWSGANRAGVITGMLTGTVITFAQPLLGGIVPAVNTIFPLTSSALCGAPLVLLTMIVVSACTEPPSPEIRKFLAEEVHGDNQ